MTDATALQGIPNKEVITPDFCTVLPVSLLGVSAESFARDREIYQKTLAFYRKHEPKEGESVPRTVVNNLEKSVKESFFDVVGPVLKKAGLKYEPPQGEKQELVLNDNGSVLLRGKSFGDFFPILTFHFNEAGALVARVNLYSSNYWSIEGVVRDGLMLFYPNNPACSQDICVVKGDTPAGLNRPYGLQGSSLELQVVPFSQTATVLQYAAHLEQMIKPSQRELQDLKEYLNALRRADQDSKKDPGFPVFTDDEVKTKAFAAELRSLVREQVQHKYLEALLKALDREFDP